MLTGLPEDVDRLTVRGRDAEKSRRDTVAVKARLGYEAYGQMLHIYAARNLVSYLVANPEKTYADMCSDLSGPRTIDWVNMGGQLVPDDDISALRRGIGTGQISSWDAVHARYDSLWQKYPNDKYRHAFAVFGMLLESETPGMPRWRAFLEQSVEVQNLVRDRVQSSRAKDYSNPFRRATYLNDEEMAAALGTLDDNSFVKQVRADTEVYTGHVEQALARG